LSPERLIWECEAMESEADQLMVSMAIEEAVTAETRKRQSR
jgi:hypothetical protein